MNTGKYGKFPRGAPEPPLAAEPGPESGQGIALSAGCHLPPAENSAGP